MARAALYRLDDLRRFVTALAAAQGVPPVRAAALATHLLWFDTAGSPRLGLATLPDILEAIAAGRVDPTNDVAIGPERNGTAVVDGRRGVPLLVLDRAAGLASEKARQNGVGVVRVANVGPVDSAAVIAAELAIGPYAAVVSGPAGRLATAMPSDGGLPLVFDPALVSRANGRKAPAAAKAETLPPGMQALTAWTDALGGEECWLVAAVAVPALESLATYHRRAADAERSAHESSGWLLPGPWEEHRKHVWGHGLAPTPAAWKALRAWAGRLGVEPPAPSGRG